MIGQGHPSRSFWLHPSYYITAFAFLHQKIKMTSRFTEVFHHVRINAHKNSIFTGEFWEKIGLVLAIGALQAYNVR
ncbi:MAG TPA: hypothetical protein IAB73_10480 [Candidatus Onthenecus intestinigallinarum]|uniref:Uncharacterized protein n=1 Tax=Candidatus Onthenecus intestinigallinarum TaxID=2840875 RepID=A0A9D1CRX3_9FIRM|nr:hypothetical protein [Candidatus Onthenecus intestinigallinarum]